VLDLHYREVDAMIRTLALAFAVWLAVAVVVNIVAIAVASKPPSPSRMFTVCGIDCRRA
jgi:hypothetical protein